MLTGKAKEDFYKYLGEPFHFMNFDNIPDFVKFSYLIHWFDSVGIYIETSMHNCKKFWCDVCFFETDEDFNADYSLVDENGNQLYFDNRKSATKMGIAKANEIYNNRNN